MGCSINKSDIDWLWVAMMRIVGATKWRAQNGRSDDGTWLRDLADMTRDRLELGVSRFRLLKRANDRGEVWAPNLMEFREYCFLSVGELQVPDVDQAYAAATARDWDLHPVIYYVDRDMCNPSKTKGRYVDWRFRDDVKTRAQFERFYKIYIKRLRCGEVFLLPEFIVRNKRQMLEDKRSINEIARPSKKIIDQELRKIRQKLSCGLEQA